MMDGFSHFIVKHKFLVILASLAVVIAASYGLPKAKFSSDYRVYFSPDNPHLNAYEDLQATFTKSDNVMFVLAPKDGQVFTQKTLAIIEELTKLAWQLPYSIRVDSVTNYQHTTAQGDDLLVGDLVINATSLSDEQLQAAKQIALNEPLLAKRLISERADVTAVNVSMELPGIDLSKETPEVAHAAYQLQSDLRAKYPDLEVYVIGEVMVDNAFKDAAIYDLTHIVPLAFLIALCCVAAYMYIASGSLVTMFSGTLIILTIIIASILFAQGLAAWLEIDITTPSANAPTMILTLAISDSIHIMATFFQQMRAGKNKVTSLLESLRINQVPVFLTSFTTVIGFLSLNSSDSPPFRDLGNIVSFGVVGAWVFSVALLPALVVALPFRVKAISGQELSWPSRLAEWIISRSRKVLLASMVIMGACMAFLPMNELSDVWIEYFDPSTRERHAAEFTRARLTGLGEITFIAKAAEAGGVSDPNYLQQLEKAANWLRQQPEIMHVSSFSDVMKRLNKNMHGDSPEAYQLPQDKELAAQYLLLYEMSLPYGLDLNNQVDINKAETRLTSALARTSTAGVLNLEARAIDWFAQNVPELQMTYGASSDIMFAHIGQTNIRSMLQGTFYALLLISLTLGISLKSAYYGFVSLLPNLLPALVAFGIWGLVDGQIGLGLSVVFGMTLGIVVDYSIHFLSKFLRAKREHHLTTEDAIRYAFNTVGVALVVSTIILFANFSVLSISNFSLNAEMGVMTAGTIVVALLVDFFFLPPLLIYLAERHKKRQSSKAAIGQKGVVSQIVDHPTTDPESAISSTTISST